MSKQGPSEPTPQPGRSVIVLDGVHRGEVGRVMAVGGGFVWVKIAGETDLIGLPLASIEFARHRVPKADEPKA